MANSAWHKRTYKIALLRLDLSRFSSVFKADERNGKLYGPLPLLLARAVPDLLIMRVLPSIVFDHFQHGRIPDVV